MDIYLKPLLLDVLKKKPGDIHEFMTNWMKAEGLKIYEKSDHGLDQKVEKKESL